MTDRAKQIMKAYEAEDTYNFPKDGAVAATLLFVAAIIYVPTFIMGMMNKWN